MRWVSFASAGSAACVCRIMSMAARVRASWKLQRSGSVAGSSSVSGKVNGGAATPPFSGSVTSMFLSGLSANISFWAQLASCLRASRPRSSVADVSR